MAQLIKSKQKKTAFAYKKLKRNKVECQDNKNGTVTDVRSNHQEYSMQGKVERNQARWWKISASQSQKDRR
jgi:hypothetical protein